MMDRQRMPVPGFPDRPARRGNSLGGAVAMRPGRTAGGQGALLVEDTRYYGAHNDDQIRRDRTPWYPVEQRSGAGTAEPDWTAAGPYRPELNMRNVTVRIMAGTSQTRAFANPQDPSVGLHSESPTKPSGNLSRALAGGATMKQGRTDRLSPARYAGQSFSQTTLEQGARR